MVQQVMTLPTTPQPFVLLTDAPTTKPPTAPPNTGGVQTTKKCHAISLWQGIDVFDQWFVGYATRFCFSFMPLAQIKLPRYDLSDLQITANM